MSLTYAVLVEVPTTVIRFEVRVGDDVINPSGDVGVLRNLQGLKGSGGSHGGTPGGEEDVETWFPREKHLRVDGVIGHGYFLNGLQPTIGPSGEVDV